MTMEEKTAATREEMVTTPQKGEGDTKRDTKTGKTGQGLPFGEAHMLKVQLAVNEPVDFPLPIVHGD